MNEKLSSKELFWVSAIIVFGTLIYTHSLNNGFLWDDNTYVWKNPLILSWTSLKNIWLYPKTAEYYPVTYSAVWLEHKVWGLSTWGYHVTSLMFHILNALLFFGLLRKMGPRLAGIIALLFTIHPIQVETVAWISEQKNLFCLFFFLLALSAFLDFDKDGKKKAYAKALLFFTAALLSKSIAICFAPVPLLYAWWKRGSLRKHDFLITLPFFMIAGVAALFHLHLLQEYEIPQSISTLPPSAVQKILIAGKIFFFYIQQIIFPQNFMTLYPKWNIDEASLSAWLYPAGVLVLYLALFWKRHRIGREFFALLCFYGISLFPVLGLIDFAWYRFSYVADHFTYLAIPSVLLLFCLSLVLICSKIRNSLLPRSWSPSSFFKKSIITAVTALVVYLSTFSFFLTLRYENLFTLWTQNLRQNPNSPFVYFYLGSLCRDTPNVCTLDQTISWFQKSAKLKPDYLYTHMFLGECYSKEARYYPKALDAYRNAIMLAKPLIRAGCYASIANIYLLQNQPSKALPYLEKAIALETESEYQRERKIQSEPSLQEAAIRRYFGITYLMLEENQKAAKLFNEAIVLNPRKTACHIGLGTALMNLGDYNNASRAFQEALKLEPQNVAIKNRLASVQALMK